MGDLKALLLIGSGGLIGSHVRACAVTRGLVTSTVDVPWQDPMASMEVLSSALTEFSTAFLGRRGWVVVWAAGAGVVATSTRALQEELDVFTKAVRAFAEAPWASRGGFVLISSAGGVHAGSIDPPFDEASAPMPVVDYGRIKLAMEEALRQASADGGFPSLILRMSNVYGPGQDLSKPQGLISQVCLANAARRPLPVFVSQGTVRDYVYVEDVAEVVLAGAARLVTERPTDPVIKIVASGTPLSVGHILGESRRVFRRPLRTVWTANPSGSGQPSDLRFRSKVWADLDDLLSTPLPVGLSRTAHDVDRRLFGARSEGAHPDDRLCPRDG